MDDMESLLRPFVDVSNVLIECQFIVHSESQLPEVAKLFKCLVVDGGRNQSRRGST